MSKEITKAKQIVHGLLVQLQAEVDSLVDAYDAIEFSLREQERILGERCATAEARVAELEVLNTLAESARQDERDAAERLRDDLREIYALRGEDSVIAAICNRGH